MQEELVGLGQPPNVVSQAAAAKPRIAQFWVISALVAAVYATVLYRLVQVWLTNDDMSHGPLVPLVVGLIVWHRWPDLVAIKPAPSLWGLVIMVLSALMLCIGPPTLPTFAFVTRLAFLGSLFGLILFIRGFATVKRLLYPFTLLLLMVPPPGFILDRITLPLQFLASATAESFIRALGMSVYREGNVLFLRDQTLSVAEACSGLRSLISLSFLGQTYLYLFDRSVWMRALMAVLILPIAVVANAGRILATAVLGQYDEAWVHGSRHEAMGLVTFSVAFVCILAVHLFLRKSYGWIRKTA